MNGTTFGAVVVLGLLPIVGSPAYAHPASGLTTNMTHDTPMASASIHEKKFLSSIQFLNPRVGFATGYEDKRFSLWRTGDGGSVWQVDPIPGAPTFHFQTPPVVLFGSANVGWAAWITYGNTGSALTVLRTADGGKHWAKDAQRISPIMHYVEQLDFISNKDGWIRAFSGGVMNQGDTSIYRTTNGGKTWTLVSAATGYVPNKQATPYALPEWDEPMPIDFTSAQDGWAAVGNIETQNSTATLYHTSTSGREWYPIRLPVPHAYQNNYVTVEYPPMFQGTAGTVLVQFSAGSNDDIVSYHTSNGSKSWTMRSSLTLAEYDNQVFFLNPRVGWIISASGSPMERTVNGGKSWSKIPMAGALKQAVQDGFTVSQLAMATVTAGWMLLNRDNPVTGVPASKLLQTTDGGHTWTTVRW